MITAVHSQTLNYIKHISTNQDVKTTITDWLHTVELEPYADTQLALISDDAKWAQLHLDEPEAIVFHDPQLLTKASLSELIWIMAIASLLNTTDAGKEHIPPFMAVSEI